MRASRLFSITLEIWLILAILASNSRLQESWIISFFLPGFSKTHIKKVFFSGQTNKVWETTPLLYNLFNACKLSKMDKKWIKTFQSNLNVRYNIFRYRPFHKTLPRSSLQINLISVRFYEMGDRFIKPYRDQVYKFTWSR